MFVCFLFVVVFVLFVWLVGFFVCLFVFGSCCKTIFIWPGFDSYIFFAVVIIVVVALLLLRHHYHYLLLLLDTMGMVNWALKIHFLLFPLLFRTEVNL